MKPEIRAFFTDGCGRCPLYKTPECKVKSRYKELTYLRSIILEHKLEESLKWAQPCYTYNKKNVLILSALKDYATISLFKGALISDPEGVLVKPGANSQSMRYLRFKNLSEIIESTSLIHQTIAEAIEIEKKGLKVPLKKNPEPIPDELGKMLESDDKFKIAFESLTPGRQRGYIIYFSQPKQSATRIRRIEKYKQQILNGKGFHDDYKLSKK